MSGIVHAIVLLLILVVFMPYAAWIPMPVIAAILFMVAYNMCEWREFVKICKTAPKSDIIVLVLTFILTVVFDLVVAIEFGLIVTAFLFMKRMSDVTRIRAWIDEGSSENDRLKKIPANTQVFEFDGPMFFATSDVISSIPLTEGTKKVILRMRNIPSLDVSALAALEELHNECRRNDIKVIFSHVNKQPMKVMKKSGFYKNVGEEYFMENIDDALSFAEKE